MYMFYSLLSCLVFYIDNHFFRSFTLTLSLFAIHLYVFQSQRSTSGVRCSPNLCTWTDIRPSGYIYSLRLLLNNIQIVFHKFKCISENAFTIDFTFLDKKFAMLEIKVIIAILLKGFIIKKRPVAIEEILIKMYVMLKPASHLMFNLYKYNIQIINI